MEIKLKNYPSFISVEEHIFKRLKRPPPLLKEG